MLLLNQVVQRADGDAQLLRSRLAVVEHPGCRGLHWQALVGYLTLHAGYYLAGGRHPEYHGQILSRAKIKNLEAPVPCSILEKLENDLTELRTRGTKASMTGTPPSEQFAKDEWAAVERIKGHQAEHLGCTSNLIR